MPANHAPLPLEPFASKTLSFSDLAHPAVAPTAGRLRRFALRLGLAGTPFAVNGILRWRLLVQKHKLWEYARGAAFLQAACEGRANQPGGESRRVLDFGGGATLPVLYLASLGWEVLSLDISPALTEWTNALARRHDWKLLGSTHDLTRSALSAELGRRQAQHHAVDGDAERRALRGTGAAAAAAGGHRERNRRASRDRMRTVNGASRS